MKRLILIALLAAMSGCSSRGAEENNDELTMAGVADRYGQSGNVAHLELGADGKYECFVINGMTAGGCGSFAGPGNSEGEWLIDGGTISFVPTSEPLDLVVKFANASAVLSGKGLLLTIDGVERLLPRM